MKSQPKVTRSSVKSPARNPSDHAANLGGIPKSKTVAEIDKTNRPKKAPNSAGV